MAGDTLDWIDTTATTYHLDGSTAYSNGKYRASVGRTGFLATPLNLVTSEVPLYPGAKERYVQTVPTILQLPLYVTADSESHLATARRLLVQVLDPRKGAGTLKHTAADGVVRQIGARCIAGLEGQEDYSMRYMGAILFDLTFQADDPPYWVDTADTTSTPGTSTSFSLTNAGDVECWPVWTWTGGSATNITQIVLTNTTTGKALTLAGLSLTNTHVIVVNALTRTITLDGATIFGKLSDASLLWELVAGSNAITVAYTGTATNISLGVAYRQRYFGV